MSNNKFKEILIILLGILVVILGIYFLKIVPDQNAQKLRTQQENEIAEKNKECGLIGIKLQEKYDKDAGEYAWNIVEQIFYSPSRKSCIYENRFVVLSAGNATVETSLRDYYTNEELFNLYSSENNYDERRVDLYEFKERLKK